MYTSNTMISADVLAALGGFLITAGLIALIATVVLVIANWKIFKRLANPDGQPSSHSTTATSLQRLPGVTDGCS